MKIIERVKLKNFGRFRELDIRLDPKMNILIGENESGKSTILSAIHHVLSASTHRVETLGIQKMLNTQAVVEFIDGKTNALADLPEAYAELWLNEQDDPDLYGKNNSEVVNHNGLRMLIRPNGGLHAEIQEILQDGDNFPFEFYSIRFETFSGKEYSGYRKYLRHILIDTTLINNDHATREFIGGMYGVHAVGAEAQKHQNEYRKSKDTFKATVLNELNDRLEGDSSFSLRNDHKSNLFTDLTITQGNTNIENKGKGKQCFIKTEFALRKAKNGKHTIDVALIEEPENHLSHINMKKLIDTIEQSDDKQLIIATHSSLISARLDLKKCILLHTGSTNPVSLNDLSQETARFFMKAPDNGILDFILSKKVILVEGAAEYILMDSLFTESSGETLDAADIHVFSVDGTSFKRYMEVAKLLGIRTAVIRDNDGNHKAICVDRYKDHVTDGIQVFADTNDARSTFEICIYQDNTDKCNDLFKGKTKATPLDYMLDNKTDAALSLLESVEPKNNVPGYIGEAVAWIRQ